MQTISLGMTFLYIGALRTKNPLYHISFSKLFFFLLCSFRILVELLHLLKVIYIELAFFKFCDFDLRQTLSHMVYI